MINNITTFLPLASAIVVAFLGVSVFLKGDKNRLNHTFSLFSLAATIWMFATFMMFLNKDDIGSVIFWDKFVYVGVVYIPTFMYHFGLALTQYKIIKGRRLLVLGYFLSTIFLLLIPTDLFVSDAFIYRWGAHTKAQVFHHAFLAFFASYIIIWFVIVFRYYKTKISPIEKERVKYCFVAFIILFIIGSLGYLPAYGIGIYPFSYVSGLIFTIIIAYAIIKHRLMDIKFVLRRSSVYVASVVLMMLLVGLAKVFLARFELTVIAEFLIDFLVLNIAVLIFPYFKNYFYKIANKYFFTTLYDSREVIAKVSDELSSTLEVKKIYKIVHKTFQETFRLESFGIVMINEKGTEYRPVFNKGFKIGRRKNFTADDFLEKVFLRKGNPIIVEELLVVEDELKKSVRETLRMLVDLGVEVLAPLDAKKKSIGLIALGKKESGDIFNDTDIQLMKIVGTQAAISLENAALYEEVKKFSIRLEKDVKEATSDLQNANDELQDLNKKLTLAYDKMKKLDRAKSEFLSIASHQLRTPLTSIKGFTSLLLEGTYGSISNDVRSTLEKVYISNERLIKLVEDLLNISRIESGRIAFDFKKGKIEDLVDEIIDSMKIAAKNKGLELKYYKPEKEIEPFVFDNGKMKEVVSNLVDNSIKYSKGGSVKITLEDLSRIVRIVIEDTGIGIRKGELEYIFERFQRGKDINQVHTEGIGLGLYVCKKIVESHKGKLWAESDGLGKGSRFIIELKKNLKAKEG